MYDPIHKKEAESESRRDLQAILYTDWDLTAIGGWIGYSSVKAKYSNARTSVLLISVCFTKDQNVQQVSKRWMIGNWKFVVLTKRCAMSDYWDQWFAAKFFVLIGVSRCLTCTVGDLNGGYIKVIFILSKLIPVGPAGFGVKITAAVTADWGPRGASVSVSAKIMLSHEMIENYSSSVKKFIYQFLPFVAISGGVHTNRRVFEFLNMNLETFMTGKIIIYFCIWGVVAAVAFWIILTVNMQMKQTSSNHTKFVQKHLRTKSIYVWACCGLTYKQAYMFNVSGNVKIKLNLLWWWFLVGDKKYDDGGWGTLGGGLTKNTRGSNCHDCHYYKKSNGEGGVWRKKYSCQGLATSAKWLCAANLTSGNHNKGSPPTCEHNKQGCRFYDWCDRQNWGDDDGTDNDSSGWDGDHDECNSPDGP